MKVKLTLALHHQMALLAYLFATVMRTTQLAAVKSIYYLILMICSSHDLGVWLLAIVLLQAGDCTLGVIRRLDLITVPCKAFVQAPIVAHSPVLWSLKSLQ